MEVIGTPFFHPQDEDYRLVRTAIAGNQNAYTVLHNRYRKAIFNLMLQRVKNPEDARDLTMEAFEKAFHKLPSYAPTHAFSTWLFRIALNNCTDFSRKKQLPVVRMQEDQSGADYFYTWLYNRRSEAPTPEEALILEQRNRLVRHGLDRLDDRYRRIIELRYYEEMGYEEIAQHLRIPVGTVKAQLYRAKENLYTLLKNSQARVYFDEPGQTV